MGKKVKEIRKEPAVIENKTIITYNSPEDRPFTDVEKREVKAIVSSLEWEVSEEVGVVVSRDNAWKGTIGFATGASITRPDKGSPSVEAIVLDVDTSRYEVPNIDGFKYLGRGFNEDCSEDGELLQKGDSFYLVI